MGTRLSYTADDIIQAARASVATTSLAKELILRGKNIEQRRDELPCALTKYCRSMLIEDLEIITAVTGIDTGTATTFLAEVGDIRNFKSSKNLT